MATVAQLKEKLAKAQEEIERLTSEVEAHYEATEEKADSLLQKVVDSRFTALIVGGAIGAVSVFYLVTC